MDEFAKSLLYQVPLAFAVGLALYRVYTDGKAERKYMMDLLERAYLKIAALNGETASDHEETLMQRPERSK